MYRKAHSGSATDCWLLNNAGARHWPINRFRLHRASQKQNYRDNEALDGMIGVDMSTVYT